MIQANELRIGNWVIDSKRGNNKIVSIHSTTVGFLCDGASCHSVHKIIEPIPLTPEILEKCGFNGIGSDFEINEVHIYSGHHEFWYWNDKVEVKLTSLHQLQNLYFALTGEELNIQL